MKRIVLLVSLFVVVTLSLTIAGCGVFSKTNDNDEVVPEGKIKISYTGQGLHYDKGSVKFDGPEFVDSGNDLEFKVRLYNGYLPEGLKVRNDTEVLTADSIRFDDGADYLPEICETKFAEGMSIVCTYTIKNVTEKIYVSALCADIIRKKIELTVENPQNTAAYVRIAKSYYFSEAQKQVYYRNLDACADSAFRLDGEFELPWGETFFVLCSELCDIAVESNETQTKLELCYDRWSPYTENGLYVYKGIAPETSSKLVVSKRIQDTEYEVGDLIVPAFADGSLPEIKYKDGKKAKVNSVTIDSSDGLKHTFVLVKSVDNDIKIKAPSFADKVDFVLSEEGDSDVNVRSLNVVDGYIYIPKEKFSKTNWLRTKIRSANLTLSAPEKQRYIYFTYSKPNVENGEEVDFMDCCCYPKGGDPSNTVFVYEKGEFRNYVYGEDLLSNRQSDVRMPIVLAYNATQKGKYRINGFRYGLYAYDYVGNATKLKASDSAPYISEFDYSSVNTLELALGSEMYWGYNFTFNMSVKPFTTDTIAIDVDASDFGGVETHLTDFATESNSHFLGELNNKSEWDPARLTLNSEKYLYLQLCTVKKVKEIKLYQDDSEVTIEYLPLTDFCGRKIKAAYGNYDDYSIFIIKMAKGYYTFAKLTIKVVYED